MAQQYTVDQLLAALNQQGYEIRKKPAVRENVLVRLLREDLHPSRWQDLADRTKPLPTTLDPKRGLQLMSQIFAGVIELRDEQNQNSLGQLVI